MMQGKYLIIDGHLPVLMPDAMSHDMIRCLKVTSAGFFKAFELECGKLEVAVHGHSESLGLQSDPKDAATIRVFMKMNGDKK